jgi:sec-independent protein translocase protein TatA
MFRNPTTDVILVIVVLLLFFGPKRLPLLGRELGRGMREFKDSITGDRHEEEEDKPALGAAPAQPDVPAAQPEPAAAPARVPEPERAPADTASDPRA